jgi:nucleoside-diphosphate-sugar epimerase
MSRIFFFGYGYTAAALAGHLREDGWEMAGTTRTQDKVNTMWEQGVEPHVWTGEAPLEGPMRVMKNVTHILHSLPPGAKGDPVLQNHARLLATIAPQLKWYGYISTTSVYGDTHGEVATEEFEPNPATARGKLRLRTEKRHLQLYKKRGLPLHIFRAGAIYGPGRSAIRRAAMGDPKLIHKEGLLTSRIHVQDLAQILRASMMKPNPGSIYNCVDDLPTGPEVPLEFAYDILGKPKPPVLEFEDVQDDLSKQLNSFYSENRRVSNAKIKSELGVTLTYPTYKEGYEALGVALKQRTNQPAD